MIEGVLNTDEYKDLSKRYDGAFLILDDEISVLKSVIGDIEGNVENKIRLIKDICELDCSQSISRSSVLKAIEKITIYRGGVKIINIVM